MILSMPKRYIVGNLQLEQLYFGHWCQIYGWEILLPNINIISSWLMKRIWELLITIEPRGKFEVMKRKLQWKGR